AAVGKRVRCPRCGEELHIPAEAFESVLPVDGEERLQKGPRPRPAPPTLEALPAGPARRPTRRPPREPERGSGWVIALAVGLGGGLLLLVGVVVAAWVMLSETSSQPGPATGPVAVLPPGNPPPAAPPAGAPPGPPPG